MVPGAIRADEPGPAPRPNVLLILLDDQNDWIGCLGGHPQVKTPQIDRLAGRGTLFANAHCQAPLCNPSRTSFLTGRRPSTTGVYALNVWFRTAEPWRAVVTLPQHFAAQGYRTLTTGKVLHDAYPPPEGRKAGTEFTVWGYHGGAGVRPARKLVETPSPMPLVDWGEFPARDEEQDDWKVADWAITQLAGRGGSSSPACQEPFLLCIGFRHPHLPCFATRAWFDLYPEDTLRLPPLLSHDRDDTPRFSWYLHWRLPEPRLAWLQSHDQWRPLVRSYLASVSFVDSQVGRVLDALDAAGLADRTIVVLASDHGWHLGEKAITGKNSLWERATRVPLIIAGPGLGRGTVCRQPVELLDLYPTLIELCKLPSRCDLEGHSLVPQLRDPTTPRPWPAITTQGPNNHAIRDERFRYIRYADGSEELYDLQADPNEWVNLASDPHWNETKRALAEWLPEVNAPPLPGGVSRLIDLRDGLAFWEGQPIDPTDPIPGIDVEEGLPVPRPSLMLALCDQLPEPLRRALPPILDWRPNVPRFDPLATTARVLRRCGCGLMWYGLR
jgi:choline-sulfatase